jgi:epoxyqueuosine reductase
MGGAAPGVRFPLPSSANEHQSPLRIRGDESSVKEAAPNPAQESGFTPGRVRSLAIEAGFAEAGLVALPYAAEERDAGRFLEWVEKGRAGTMRYLESRSDDGRLKRERVGVSFPWARSAIVCFASYRSAAPLSTETQERGSAWIARYAVTSRRLPGRDGANGERRPSDYHKVLLRRLKTLETKLHTEFGAFESRAYVDTGPVVERALAVAAGVGWIGKNTCLIHPKLGSWGFLAVLLTALQVNEGAREQATPASTDRSPGAPAGSEGAGRQGTGNRDQGSEKQVPRDQGDKGTRGQIKQSATPALVPDRCGTCTRCIEACPTHALDVPYQMDATRCISYLTIEHKGPIAEELMPGIGRQVFGCDICQDVCPWNRKAPIVADAELEPCQELINPALEWLAAMNEADYQEKFNGSPVRRAGFNGLRRNVAIAMGNSGLARFVPKLEEWADAADEGLRSAVRWALGRLRNR